ncbi:MAG: SBBP repeat-containing protein [Phycisphaerales bacterium]|nr:SBBP repeat-containing protein [Phycisphaerales bacterium]
MRHLFSHLLLLAVAAHAFAGIEPPRASTETINLGLRGVYFVPNEGQWSDREVIYGLRSRGLNVAFRESSLTMHLARQVGNEASASRGKGSAPPRIDDVRGDSSSFDAHESRGDEASAPAWEQLTLTVTFPGSNNVQPIGAQPQSAKFNYFVGGQGRNTAANVPSFGAVIYENLYDGIDLHVMGSADGVLKYEFHCAPGADHNQIRIHYDGIDSLCIDDAGDLRISTPKGAMSDTAPVAWQSTGPRAMIPARFELIDDQTYGVALLGRVDAKHALVIDPKVRWMRYLGGDSDDRGWGLVVDAQGGIYVVGETPSDDFEGARNEWMGNTDAYVLKLSGTGELRWMTYLGGSGVDRGYGMVTNHRGGVFVTGETSSSDFQGRRNALRGGTSDAFLLSVSSSGALQGMRYLGGNGRDVGYALATDSGGGAFVSGLTSSADFDGRNNELHGREDAFVARLGESGAIAWATYLGGIANDVSQCIVVDSGGNTMLAGETSSDDFELRTNEYHPGSPDAFIARVDPFGEAQWATYLGGSDYEHYTAIALDSTGNAFVTGGTASTDFPDVNNSSHGTYDAFLVKVNSAGSILWSTMLGGSGVDMGRALAIDGDGDLYVAGETGSWDFEGQNNSIHGGVRDAFVTKLSPFGVTQAMAFLGGNARDIATTIAVDQQGQAIVGGTTISDDVEGRGNSIHNPDHDDAFVLKIRVTGPLLGVESSCPLGGPIEVSWHNATAGAPVALVHSADAVIFRIPDGYPCAGQLLNIGANSRHIVYLGRSGHQGTNIIMGTAGPQLCGNYLQLFERTTCDKSNVVRIE